MFQTFISRHNSNFFSDKLVLTSVTPDSSAPVLQTPKATSSTLYFDSLTVNAGNGGFLHCIQMDTSVNAANQVVSVGADIAFEIGRASCREREESEEGGSGRRPAVGGARSFEHERDERHGNADRHPRHLRQPEDVAHRWHEDDGRADHRREEGGLGDGSGAGHGTDILAGTSPPSQV